MTSCIVDEMPVKRLLPARWVFDVVNWKPNQQEWEKAIRCIQQEEKQRIERFVYKEDTKCSLIGRLMMRKLCSESLCIPYNTLRLGRTAKDRPFLIPTTTGDYSNNLETNGAKNETSNTLYDFNISHQGNYCVLAAETNSSVGIDVMKMAHFGNQTLPEMFNLMHRKFTNKEWEFICGPVPEKERSARFYRNWSLKESFVKAEGSGLGFELRRLSFQCNTPSLSIGTITVDTKLYIDGELADDWYFEECLLDPEHCVVVALLKPKQEALYPIKYKHLDFDELIENAKELLENDPNTWQKFVDKSVKSK